MITDLASTNVSFNFLRGSTDFLTLILDNINSCVLLLNNKMELIAFNNALTTLFPRNKLNNLNYIKCGEAIGCAYQIEERKECGNTTKCRTCEIRVSAITSYLENKFTSNKEIIRPFYNENNEKIYKKLRYSVRLFPFKGEKYIILLIESAE